MADKLPRGCNGPECKFTECRTKEHLLYHVKNSIPTRLKYDDLGIVPVRQDFIDPKLRAIFAAQVSKGAPLIFMPNDIIEKNDRVDNQLKYRIYMTGVLPCGSRAMLILDGIEVHFDIMVPDGTTPAAFDDLLRGLLVGKNVPFTGIKNTQALKLKGFQKAPRPWKRITFDTLQDRKKGIDMIEALNREYADAGKPKLETAADDCKRGTSDYYFPKVARELRFATADWNRIEKYTAVPARTYSPNCDYVLRVNINNLKKLDKQKREELKNPNHILSQVMDRDNTMVAQWDIETWRKVQNGMVPTPADEDYVIFMMCAAYFWHHSMDPMMAVCCFHTTSEVRKGMLLSIECANERDVLFAHMYVKGKMSPEILSAFNGQNFDWPLYREKLRREGLLVELKRNLSALTVLQNETETNVLKWCFTSTNIKIDAETKHRAECVAKFPGMIDIDVLPIFLKMYPKMEVRKSFSLNFFLQKNGLESKEDMHFKTMFKIYERARKLSERSEKYRKCHCDELRQFLAAQSMQAVQNATAGTIDAGTAIPTVWKPHCACCDKVPEIDCKKNPKFVPNGNEPEFTPDLHDDLVHVPMGVVSGDSAVRTEGTSEGKVSTEGAAVPKCCQCGKAPRNLNDMRDVAYYCTIDTIRPQQLCVKRAILPDKRELSTMSYVSLYDSFFRADGMKVRNVIGSYCHRRGIAFSNAGSGKTPEEKDHYPGAWVFPPERGLNAKRPITGLDFASLYPSLMMCYNLSPDMVVYSKDIAEALAAEGYSIHYIKPFNFERGAEKGSAGNKHLTAEGWTVRHNGLFNPKKNKKAVIEYVKTVSMAFKITSAHELFGASCADIVCAAVGTTIDVATSAHNAAVAEVHGKIVTNSVSYGVIATDKSIDAATREVYIEYPERGGATSAQELTMQYMKEKGLKPARRVKYIPVEGRDPLPGERMGIFAFIVKKLFDKRVPIKGEFVRLSKLLEQMELAKTKVWTYRDAKGQEHTTTMADVKFQIAKVDSKQKALKVLANTFYGESGNYLSSIYELLVAAGITSAGQENIKKVAGFITGKGYGPRYGDSVTHDTPVLVRFPNSDIGYRTIDDLTFDGKPLEWQQYGPVLPDGTVKEQARTDLYAWSDVGWTEINRVIRHRTDKDIYRVLTHTGVVDVTSDHSLLSPAGDRITPLEVRVGTALMHADLPSRNDWTNDEIHPSEAYSMGLFWSDGSCGIYEYDMKYNNREGTYKGNKYSWAINNQNLDFLRKSKEGLEYVYPGYTFKILDTMKSSNVYKLVATCERYGGIKELVLKYRKLFYDDHCKNADGYTYKSIPNCILNSDPETKSLFMEGYYAGDGDKDAHGYVRFDNKGKIGSAALYHLQCELGYKTSLNTRSDKPDVYRITCTRGGKNQRKDATKIKKIVNLGKTQEYVYDLETANHHFSAGIGRMIVHNTDSIYTTCPEAVYAAADAKFASAMAAVNEKYADTPNVPEPTTDAEKEYKAARVKARTEYWTEMVDITMKVMNALKEEVSDYLLSDNGTCFLNMAYEEVGFPTVLCGKKKYYLTPHIETINFYPKDVFIRGIDIIKQGQTQISKKLGDEFMRESLSPANERELIDIAVDKIRKFYSMNLDSTMFALSAKYNPTKKNVPVLTFVSRMKEMQKKYAPGTATPNPTLYALYEPPEPGDKFAYVIVKKDQHFTLQGKKIEIKKGDQMEFLRVYNEFANASKNGSTVPAMEIDMNYYVKNAIVGIFARFIAYHPRFQPPAGKYDPQDKDQYKQMDEFCVSAAGKYLEELCDSITGFDKTEVKKRGQDYRAVYRRADKAIREELTARYGAAAEILHSIDVHDTTEDNRARSTRIVEQIKQHCRAEALTLVGDNSEKYVDAMSAHGIGVFKLKRIYKTDKGGGAAASMTEGYKRAETEIIDKLFKTLGPTSRIIYDYEQRFIEIIDEMRAEGITDPKDDQIQHVNALDKESEQNLETVHSLTLRLTTIYMLQERLKRLIDHIEKLRMKAINEPVDPKINPRELSKQEAKSSPIIEDFQWG
jgi:DNA polymerase elongation subunit (family B)